MRVYCDFDKALSDVEVSKGFPEFVRWCRDRGMPLTVVSDSAVMLNEERQIVVFIGEDLSNVCVARWADVLFARGRLARYARAQRIPFLPFENFSDVTHALAFFAVARGSKRSRRRVVSKTTTG